MGRKTSAKRFAPGKAAVGYVLPAKLIEKIATMAVKERKRPSHVAERLLALGLKTEGSERTSDFRTSEPSTV